MKYLFLFLLMCSSGFAETIVKEREKQLERMILPERLTFGPEDNFQGARSPNGKEMILTQKLHMTPGLERLDLTTRTKSDMGDRYSSGEQAQFNSAGQFVFRSTREKADGEICYQDRYADRPQCLAGPPGEKQFPFWLGTQQIGYLLKNRSSNQTELRVIQLGSKQEQVLLGGNLLHPFGSPNGQDIVMIDRSTSAENRLSVFNASTSKKCQAKLAWPGSLAFPTYSTDGKQIVFAFYPSDSNNDGKIDVSDRSMIAKVSAQDVCAGQDLVPEVLSSLEQDCGHPRLSESLDMTCAFEGSLDLYQAPATGLVPATWTAKELVRAHVAARSPEERLFVLWTLQKRFPEALTNLQSRIFAQFLILRDDVAALAWMDRARSELKMTDPQRKLWGHALMAGQLRKSEPPGEITISLRRRIEILLNEAEKSPASSMKTIALVRIRRILGADQLTKAKTDLLSVVAGKTASYPEFLLSSLEWEDLSQRGLDLPENRFMEFLKNNFTESSAEPLPYWVRSLERLEKVKSSERRKVISAVIEKLTKSSPARVLLEMETRAMNVAENTSKDAYFQFDKAFSDLRTQPAVLRFVAYRAIRLWTKADKLKEVQFVSSNLLKFIESPSLEWTAARDYYITSEFDRAYESELNKDPVKALGHFFGAATLTDDLEAHWGTLRNMVASNSESDVLTYTQELLDRKFTDVLAPRIQAMADLALNKKVMSADEIDQFLTRFDRAPGGSHPISLFLQGSLRLDRLMLTPWTGSDAQLKESDKVNRDLTLALDGAMDNERLRAAVINNLALLYSHTKQWGSAERAWLQRSKYPFTLATDLAVSQWLRAQALFHLGDFERASASLEKFESKDVRAEWQFPIFHRKAFYASIAQKPEIALKAAETALAASQSLAGTKHEIQSVRFLKARALWALKRNSESYDQFVSLMKDLDADPENPKMTEVPAGNHPRRLKILVAGFLVQLADQDAVKKSWLERRLNLLNLTVADAKAIAIPSDALYEARLKAELALLDLTGDSSRLKMLMTDLDLYRNEAGIVASIPWYECLQGVMILNLGGRLAMTGDQRLEVTKRLDLFFDSAGKLPYPSPLLASQILHLRSSRYAFEKGGELKRQDRQFFDQLLASEPLQKLKGDSPALGKKTAEWVQFFGEQVTK